MKFKDYNGADLKGEWLFTVKVDGIQCKKKGKKHLSKGLKPLFNIPKTEKKFEIAEIYVGNRNDTWSIVSASVSERRMITEEEIYPLYPEADERLIIQKITDPTESQIRSWFETAREMGYEGLVLRQGTKFIKVKDKYTIDVKVTGLEISTAPSHPGLLKEFITEKGRVGTGLTKDQRNIYLDKSLIGTYIEVEVTELSKNGKMIHPRFIRLRPDKS